MTKVLLFDSVQQSEATLPLNEIKTLRVEGKELCIVRTAEGIFVFEKECPHRGFDLTNGHINGQSEVVCPYHAYRFHLKTGEEGFQQCEDLKVFSTRLVSDQIFIEL